MKHRYIYMIIVATVIIFIPIFYLVSNSTKNSVPADFSADFSSESHDKPANNEYVYGNTTLYYTLSPNVPHELRIIKNGIDTTLNTTIPFDVPGGSLPVFHTTGEPTVVLVTAQSGDGGGFWQGWYYINLVTEEVTVITNSNGPTLTVNNQKIALQIEDPCGYQVDRINGQTARLTGLLINDTDIGYAFDNPRILTCVDPGGIGSVYSPQLSLTNVDISDDLSLVYFTAAAVEWSNDQMNTVWEDEFVFEIASQKVIHNDAYLMNWNTVNVEYPDAKINDGRADLDLPPGVSLNSKYSPSIYPPDVGQLYYTINLLEKGRQISAVLSKDLKLMFYTTMDETDHGVTFSFVVANLLNKNISQLETFTVNKEVSDIAKRAAPSPHIVGDYFEKGYVAYNWFSRSPRVDEVKTYNHYDYLAGRVREISSLRLLWANSCNEFITEFNFDISEDGKALLAKCDDRYLIFSVDPVQGNWNKGDDIAFPEGITPDRVSFANDEDNSRISFIDSSDESGGCLFPRYSMMWNGEELERTGESYLCF